MFEYLNQVFSSFKCFNQLTLAFFFLQVKFFLRFPFLKQSLFK